MVNRWSELKPDKRQTMFAVGFPGSSVPGIICAMRLREICCQVWGQAVDKTPAEVMRLTV